jgi:hypothetical protein
MDFEFFFWKRCLNLPCECVMTWLTCPEGFLPLNQMPLTEAILQSWRPLLQVSLLSSVFPTHTMLCLAIQLTHHSLLLLGVLASPPTPAPWSVTACSTSFCASRLPHWLLAVAPYSKALLQSILGCPSLWQQGWSPENILLLATTVPFILHGPLSFF